MRNIPLAIFKTVCVIGLLGLFITSINAQESATTFEFRGVKKMDLQFLKRLTGELVQNHTNTKQLDELINKLNRLNGIANASVVDSLSSSQKTVIQIVEKRTLIPNLKAWSSQDDFAYRVGLYDYNFLGKNMVLGGYYQKNIYNTFGFNFHAPYLLHVKWGLGFNFLNWQSLEPLYFEDQTATYKYQNLNFEVLAFHEINARNLLQFGLAQLNEAYQIKTGVISTEFPEELETSKLFVKGFYRYDNLKHDYNLISGVKNEFNLQVLLYDTNNKNSFYIFWNDFHYFKRIGAGGNWATRLRVGLAQNNESPLSPFSLDNNINVRGVGVQIDRGTGSVVLNTEYRQNLIEKRNIILQGNVFLDSGSWRNPGGKWNDFVQSDNIRIYSGLGLRLIHKKIFNAVIRLDYGYGLNKNASQGFVFGIGQYF